MTQFAAMLWKELTQEASRKRFPRYRTLVVLGLGTVFVLLAYSSVYQGERGLPYARMSRFSREFFFVMTGVLAVLLSLGAMVQAAGVVAGEAVRKRLALLLVLPLGSWSIIGSKALGVVVQILMLMLSTLPVVVLLGIFGGVNAEMVLVGALFVISNAWLYCAVGLFASTAAPTIVRAASIAALAAVAWNVFVPAAIALWEYEISKSGGRPGAWPLMWLSPFFVFGQFVLGGISTAGIVAHAAVDVGLGAFLFAAAALLFRPLALRRLAGAPARSKFLVALRKKARGASSWAGFMRRFFQPGVIWKELGRRNWPLLAPFSWFAIVWGVVLVVSGVTGEWIDFYDGDFQAAMFVAETLGFLVFLSLAASVPVAAEKDAATLQLLGITALSHYEILGGKAVALVLDQLPAFLVLLAHAILVWAWRASGQTSIAVIPGLFVWTAYAVVLGLYFSLAAKRTVHAMIATVAVWFGGLPLLMTPLLIGLAILDVDANDIAHEPLGVLVLLVGAVMCVVALRRIRKRGMTAAWGLVIYTIAVSTAITAVAVATRNDDAYAALCSPALAVGACAMSAAGEVTGAILAGVAVTVYMAEASLVAFEAQVRKSQ